MASASLRGLSPDSLFTADPSAAEIAAASGSVGEIAVIFAIHAWAWALGITIGVILNWVVGYFILRWMLRHRPPYIDQTSYFLGRDHEMTASGIADTEAEWATKTQTQVAELFGDDVASEYLRTMRPNGLG